MRLRCARSWWRVRAMRVPSARAGRYVAPAALQPAATPGRDGRHLTAPASKRHTRCHIRPGTTTTKRSNAGLRRRRIPPMIAFTMWPGQSGRVLWRPNASSAAGGASRDGLGLLTPPLLLLRRERGHRAGADRGFRSGRFGAVCFRRRGARIGASGGRPDQQRCRASPAWLLTQGEWKPPALPRGRPSTAGLQSRAAVSPRSVTPPKASATS